MDKKQLMRMTEMTLEAWNNQDVDAVLARYTEDYMYGDPNTGEAIRDQGTRGLWPLPDKIVRTMENDLVDA